MFEIYTYNGSSFQHVRSVLTGDCDGPEDAAYQYARENKLPKGSRLLVRFVQGNGITEWVVRHKTIVKPA